MSEPECDPSNNKRSKRSQLFDLKDCTSKAKKGRKTSGAFEIGLKQD